MKWEPTPKVKIYEALGAVADERMELSGNSAKMYSSSGNKFYTITFDPSTNSIMSNDNISFWKSYLGYPAIAFLMKIGEIPYSPELAEKLKGVAWKDINQKFKNDFEAALVYILQDKTPEERTSLAEEVARIDEQLQSKSYNLLGSKTKPPEGY